MVFCIGRENKERNHSINPSSAICEAMYVGEKVKGSYIKASASKNKSDLIWIFRRISLSS